MRELAEITAYMSPAHAGYLDPKSVFPQSSDRLIHPIAKVSVKKRLILQAMGYLSACMVVLSSTGKAIDLFYKFSKLIELFQKYILHSS